LLCLITLLGGCGWYKWILPFQQAEDGAIMRSESQGPPEGAPHVSQRVGDTALGNTALGNTALGNTALGNTASADIEELLRVAIVQRNANGQPLLDEQGRQRFVDVVGWQWHDSPQGPYHWTQAGLERWSRLPPRERPPLAAALDSRDSALAANAAIGLARVEGPRHAQLLLDVIHPFTLSVEGRKERRAHDPAIRRAAIETLAALDDPNTPALLDRLFETYAVYRPEDEFSQYSAELHVELLRAVARHTSPARDARVIGALEHPQTEIRVEAVRLIAADHGGPVPQLVIDLARGGAHPLRRAAIEALGRRGEADAAPVLAAAAYDPDIGVRLAAIEALGRVGGETAVAELRTILHQEKTRIQEVAVAALGGLGDWQSVHYAAAHDDWRVRRAAAYALAGDDSDGAISAAAALARDASSDVQQVVVASLDRWPIDRAGPVLLAACESIHPNVRREAIRALGRRWQPAEQVRRAFELPPGDGAGPLTREVLAADALHRGQLLEELAIQWRAEFGEPPLEDRPAPIISAREAADPERLAAQLGSSLPAQRRAALEQLARTGAAQPLSDEQLVQLAQLAGRETDLANWQLLLAAVSGAEGELVDEVLYAALRQSSPEISVTACGMLARRGSPKHAARLTPLLESRSPAVVAAALDALTNCGPLDDVGPLQRLLTDRSHPLRVEAAFALARLGYSMGGAALERLMFDDDLPTRRRAVTAAGELRDPMFLGALVAQLDPRNDDSLRRAALAALPEVVGLDVTKQAGGSTATATAFGEEPAQHSMESQAARWIEWYLSGGRA
jgi:HEAT repeat protein